MTQATLAQKNLVKRAARTEARRLGCTQCAAPLTVHDGMGAEQISCSYCGAVIDLTKPDHAVLRTIALDRRPPAAFTLGARGRLKGVDYEVIGRILMEERDEDGVYPWNEYLLFNPDKGYVWLEEENGHWLFGRKCRHKPDVDVRLAQPGQTFRAYDERFRFGDPVEGRVAYVEGEFPYQAAVGDVSHSISAVAAPHVLSAETTATEVEWIISEYIPASTVQTAFEDVSVPAQRGTHRARPQVELKGYVLFCTAPFVLGLACLALAGWLASQYPGRTSLACTVPPGVYQGGTGPEQTGWTSDAFEIDGPDTLHVRCAAPLRDAWLALRGTVKRNDGSAVGTFILDLSYYPDGTVVGNRTTVATVPVSGDGRYRIVLAGTGGSGPQGTGQVPSVPLELSVVAERFDPSLLIALGSWAVLFTIPFVFFGGTIKSLYEMIANWV